MSRLRNYKRLYRILKLRDKMKDTIKKASDIKKKPTRTKYIMPAVIIFLCIFAGLVYRSVKWTPVDSESKKASEAIIRQAAAEQLTADPDNPIDPNTLTDGDFVNVTQLDIVRIELYDIMLLKKFTNLQKLYLGRVVIPKKAVPKWMAILAKVNILNLDDRFSLDLSPIRNLHYLKSIILRNSQVSSIEPIKKFKNLETLDISRTQVTDLSPLRDMMSLRVLEMDSTSVSDIEPIAKLINLEHLDLNSIQVSDIEPVRGLKNLSSLIIDGTNVENLEPIKELVNLRQLFLRNCPNISDEQIEELQKALPNLKITK